MGTKVGTSIGMEIKMTTEQQGSHNPTTTLCPQPPALHALALLSNLTRASHQRLLMCQGCQATAGIGDRAGAASAGAFGPFSPCSRPPSERSALRLLPARPRSHLPVHGGAQPAGSLAPRELKHRPGRGLTGNREHGRGFFRPFVHVVAVLNPENVDGLRRAHGLTGEVEGSVSGDVHALGLPGEVGCPAEKEWGRNVSKAPAKAQP